MTILLLGSGGQLGHSLISSKPAHVQLSTHDYPEVDLGDTATISSLVASVRPRLIINAAAYTAVDKAESDDELAMRINGRGPGTLAQSAAEIGARLVHISTDFVFDGQQSRAYRPTDMPNPLSVYGRSKWAGEQAIARLLPAADFLILRTSWLYAAHGANFVKTMLKLMATRDELNVVADQIGTPTHANNLALVIWQLIDGQASGIHHFSDEGAASWYDFAVAIQDEALALGLLTRAIPVYPITTAEYPTPAQRPAFSLLDKTSLRALTGQSGQHWRHALRDMLQDLKDTHGT